jgi:hypothetical protein
MRGLKCLVLDSIGKTKLQIHEQKCSPTYVRTLQTNDANGRAHLFHLYLFPTIVFWSTLLLVTASPPHSSHTHPTTSGSRDARSSARRRRPRCPELMATPMRGELLSPSRARDQGGGARQRAGCGSLRSSPVRELLPQGRLTASARPGVEPLAAGSGSPPTARAAAPRV